MLDYDKPGHQPFADVFRQPRRFRFFKPAERDLEMPTGFVLNSGRSSLSDDPKRIRFATSTFNSGKATPTVDMPDENPIHISEMLADRYKIQTGDRVRVSSRETGESIVLPALVSNRVKGETAYVSFHKCKAEIEDGRYINSITSNRERCAYTAQTGVKATAAVIERVQPVSEPARAAMAMAAGAGAAVAPAVVDTCRIDPRRDLPVWQGQSTPLCVTEIIRETHDVYTYRFQGDPLCRFVYLPGQFCTLVLNIDGKKVVRSYSISSAPTRPFTLEITVKRVPGGLVSNWLADNVKVGDRIEISGPKGKFTLEPGKIPRKILFIGGGSGITPLMSMTRWLSDVAAPTDVIFSTPYAGRPTSSSIVKSST